MEEKKYFRIKDVAEFLGENPSTLRYWETEFKELTPGRGMKGRRLYTSDDIEQLRVIQYLLRVKGMHIKAAQEQIKRNANNVSTRVLALKALEESRDELKGILAALSKREGKV